MTVTLDPTFLAFPESAGVRRFSMSPDKALPLTPCQVSMPAAVFITASGSLFYCQRAPAASFPRHGPKSKVRWMEYWKEFQPCSQLGSLARRLQREASMPQCGFLVKLAIHSLFLMVAPPLQGAHSLALMSDYLFLAFCQAGGKPVMISGGYGGRPYGLPCIA